jgi:hypothetical protein
MMRLLLVAILGALAGCDSSDEVITDASLPLDAGEDAALEDAGQLQDAGELEDAGPLLIEAQGNEHRPEGIAHCYTELSSSHDATQAFWVVFTNGRFEERDAVTAGLADAAEMYPDEEEFALLHGLAALWRLAEPTADEEDDMAGLIAAATTARSELERAYELCPTDHRLPAWLGPIIVNTGRAIGDDATIDQGLEVLQQGIDNYPSFVLFSKLLIFAQEPKDDPSFQGALEALTENEMVCELADPACSNHPRAAHNREGASIFMGDVHAKAGDREAALEAYERILDEPDYASWDYRALLEDRIAMLDERIASFDNADAADDFKSAWSSTYQCSICHKN